MLHGSQEMNFNTINHETIYCLLQNTTFLKSDVPTRSAIDYCKIRIDRREVRPKPNVARLEWEVGSENLQSSSTRIGR